MTEKEIEQGRLGYNEYQREGKREGKRQ